MVELFLMQWVSNTWWFSRCVDDVWVSHLHKIQTTPTILHNEECYPPSNDTLDFCAKGGQIQRQHVVVKYWPTCVMGTLSWKNNLATFYFTYDHFRDMAQPILPFNLVFIEKWPMYNLLLMLSTYTTLSDQRVTPYNTTMESRESLIMESRSTPSSTPILMISNSLVLIRNC